MKERDYLLVSNMAHLDSAIDSLNRVQANTVWGVDPLKIESAQRNLSDIRMALRGQVNGELDNEEGRNDSARPVRVGR